MATQPDQCAKQPNTKFILAQLGDDDPAHIQAATPRAPSEISSNRQETFDLIVREYGASIWCDPYR